ncbi:MAG: 4'-phosphopantetheinyl transferase superfamily protein [Bacteroidia bacterium]|nr:4'-phosphopantetheinyl transferase superfamily protein [Bacteroidia bacterium]
MNQIRQINTDCRLALLWMHEFVKENPAPTKRETEKNGTLYLLNLLFHKKNPKLEYHENGKPFVKDLPGGISISHSHDLLAIFADERNTHTGLDVELIRDKVLKIRHKFLSEKEKSFIPEKNVLMHIMAWCVKETMYKIHSERKVEFIEHLLIEPFKESDEIIQATCCMDNVKFTKQLKIEQMDEYLISYPIN